MSCEYCDDVLSRKVAFGAKFVVLETKNVKFRDLDHNIYVIGLFN